MPRYRNRGMALRPINRIKHVIDTSALVGKNVVFGVDLIHTVDAPVISVVNQCITGSKVNGIYLKVLIASNEATVAAAIPNIYMTIQKNPGHNLGSVAPNNVGANDNKKFIIHQEMSMIENRISGNATVLFNGVIKIPRGYIRNGPDDRLELNILCPSIDITFCVQAHYKEFR